MQTSRRGGPAKTVDAYIASSPKEMRTTLKDLRRTIKGAAPEAEETISYQMPAYKHHGFVVFFAAFKNHMSLYAPGISEMKRFNSRLKPYTVSGATIHFSEEKPLPLSLVKEIVRARMKENELRFKRKKKSSKGSR